jgi:hypothetical protein
MPQPIDFQRDMIWGASNQFIELLGRSSESSESGLAPEGEAADAPSRDRWQFPRPAQFGTAFVVS